jgi:hypothetical protein
MDSTKIMLLYPSFFSHNFHRAHTTYRLIQVVFLLKTVVTSRNWLKTLANTGVPPYPQVMRSKTYCGYVKPQIIPNAIYIMIFT